MFDPYIDLIHQKMSTREKVSVVVLKIWIGVNLSAGSGVDFASCGLVLKRQ